MSTVVVTICCSFAKLCSQATIVLQPFYLTIRIIITWLSFETSSSSLLDQGSTESSGVWGRVRVNRGKADRNGKSGAQFDKHQVQRVRMK